MAIDYKQFRQKFHLSWWGSLQPFIESDACLKILTTLGEESKTKTILPSKDYIWRVFKETDLNTLKVVFLALSPYPQINTGDGLAFSNSLTKVESPSLKIILNAIENDIGYKDERNRDLSRWSKQGVLLLNSALTLQSSLPKSHLEIWKPFIEFLYKKVFYNKELIFLYFGADARAFQVLENGKLHKSLAIEHPAYSSRQNRPLIHKNCFSWCNKMLKEQGKSEINWLEYREEVPWAEEKVNYKEFI